MKLINKNPDKLYETEWGEEDNNIFRFFMRRRCIKCHNKVQDPSSALCAACEDEILSRKFRKNIQEALDF